MAPLFIPRRAFGANDRLSFGIIGTGNRGSYLHPAFMKLGAECVAVCDTYEPYMTRAKALSPAGCKTYADYHELIAHPGLDFVVVATPDHQHRPMLYAALEAGKDVYLEKPFSMNMAQSAEMVSRVRQTDRIVQVGMQRRSMPFIYAAKKLIDDGELGKVWLAQGGVELELHRVAGGEAAGGETRLGPVPGRRAEAPVGDQALPLVARILGLLGRQHDRPGHAPDGRGAVVDREYVAEIGGLERKDLPR